VAAELKVLPICVPFIAVGNQDLGDILICCYSYNSKFSYKIFLQTILHTYFFGQEKYKIILHIQKRNVLIVFESFKTQITFIVFKFNAYYLRKMENT
jgi:hypothetical protein